VRRKGEGKRTQVSCCYFATFTPCLLRRPSRKGEEKEKEREKGKGRGDKFEVNTGAVAHVLLPQSAVKREGGRKEKKKKKKEGRRGKKVPRGPFLCSQKLVPLA